MKTRKLRFNKMAIALFLSVLTMSAVAQQQGPKSNRGECQNKCQKIPDLTEKQKADIKVLKTEHIKTMNAYKVDLNVLKAELKKLEVSESADQKAINAKIDEIFAIKTTMAKQKSQHRQKVRSLLTDEQKIFFDAHAGRGYGHGKGHGNGPHNGARGSGCPRG